MRLLLASFLPFLPLTVQAEYLGNLSANEFDPNSVANPFATANPFSSNSDTNEFGRYRNPYSNQSATNPYATDTPMLYDQQGHYRGKLSTNQYDPDSVSNPWSEGGCALWMSDSSCATCLPAWCSYCSDHLPLPTKLISVGLIPTGI